MSKVTHAYLLTVSLSKKGRDYYNTDTIRNILYFSKKECIDFIRWWFDDLIETIFFNIINKDELNRVIDSNWDCFAQIKTYSLEEDKKIVISIDEYDRYGNLKG